jgi:hypothetical protein
VAKSVYGSGLISAKGDADQPSIKCRSALDAASAASFHPVKALMNTGLRSRGFDNHCTEAGVAITVCTLSEQARGRELRDPDEPAGLQ